MSFEELVTRLDWFVEEKGNLEDAETAVRGVQSDVNAISFNLAANSNLSAVKAAYDDARAAILDEMDVSLDAGGDLLYSLSGAIAQTGRNYLEMESANTEYATTISILIANSGL
ncbi:hypothetical protein [Tessaracoccus antarcticus]|uniref:Uncharacterized protein n=1 Tax=Tessaracoccus antarcticus TaxID=2479848 RepID=A0A3M0G9W3_9ACTN|nr:hypothetical protein [Tessaracoccus antarcticus]RMB61831.1 hypothetical protein EAX62_04265 [Tessaracoccus antarcticus]